VLFLSLAVDARRRSDSIAARHSVPAPSVRSTAIYELVAVLALATTEVIALHAIYQGQSTQTGIATIIVLMSYAGYIIAAPWLTRAIRAAAGNPDPSHWLIARTMTLGGLVALAVAIVVVRRMPAPWWLLILACVPIAVSVVAVSVERRREIRVLARQER
jgi:peptidoglycan/LPS O-acetylase OafA/YrhL